MKTNSRRGRLLRAASVGGFLVLFSTMVLGAVTVTPSTTDYTYKGSFTVAASVPSGADAKVLIYLDFNRNGSVDSSEFAIQQFDVKDSQTAPPSGSVVVADLDGQQNGSLSLNLRLFPQDSLFAGQYIIRVKTSSTDQKATVVVNAPSAPQSVAGQIRLGGTTPTPGVVRVGYGPGENDAYYIVSDANGNYTAPVATPDQNITLLAYVFQMGGAHDSNDNQTINVGAGAHLTGVNLNSALGTHRYKGRVTRSDTGAGVASLMINVGNWESDSTIEFYGWTDSNGYFDLPIVDGCWDVEFDEQDVAQRGFFGWDPDLGNCDATVSGADVTGAAFSLSTICAYATGRIENALTHTTLEGAMAGAHPSEGGDTIASSQTNPDGRFAIALIAGSYNIGGDIWNDSSLHGQYLVPTQQTPVTIVCSSGNQDVGTIGFLPVDRWLNFAVHQLDGSPMAGLEPWVYGNYPDTSQDYSSGDFTTAADGSARLPYRSTGKWTIGFNEGDIPSGFDPIAQRRIEAIIDNANIVTAYPTGYLRRPYLVYGSNNRLSLGGSDFYPPDSGGVLIGQAIGTQVFVGSYSYYYIVTYDGMVRVDAIMGSNGQVYSPSQMSSVQNSQNLSDGPDGAYATLGIEGDRPWAGYIEISPSTTLDGIIVFHPNDSASAFLARMLVSGALVWPAADVNHDGAMDAADIISTLTP